MSDKFDDFKVTVGKILKEMNELKVQNIKLNKQIKNLQLQQLRIKVDNINKSH